VIFEIDKAIMGKRLVEPTFLEIPDDFGVDAKAEQEKENSKLISYYEIEKINWERSNHKVPYGDQGKNLRIHKGSNTRLCHCYGVPGEGGESVH
jgi:hypothetical protein